MKKIIFFTIITIVLLFTVSIKGEVFIPSFDELSERVGQMFKYDTCEQFEYNPSGVKYLGNSYEYLTYQYLFLDYHKKGFHKKNRPRKFNSYSVRYPIRLYGIKFSKDKSLVTYLLIDRRGKTFYYNSTNDFISPLKCGVMLRDPLPLFGLDR